MHNRIAVLLTGLTAIVHLAFANRYALFRDELYFIVCGRHPAFGYADQPPIIPLLAAGFYALGNQTWVERLPAVFAAAALVWLVVSFVRLLGGSAGAAWIAGIAAATAPMLLGLTATLNTTTLEPLTWTLVAYGLARAVLIDDRRALLWTGAIAGLEMEAKYALPVWLVSLAVALLLTPERRIFRVPQLWIGIAIATIIALPSVLWQALHGFPFVELVANAGDKDVAVAPLAFFANQVLVFDPLYAPIWLGGVIAPFMMPALRPMRFIAIACALTALAIVFGHGKDYYLAPIYPALFAIGAVAIERVVRNAVIRSVYLTAGVALACVGAPLSLPILSPAALIAYQTALHLQPQEQERSDEGAMLPSTFADMLGWHEFVGQVARAYDAIPPEKRSTTGILVDNYGEAAALDVYGPAYGLPPALSGHNQYYFWRLRGQNPTNIVRVQNKPERLAPYCTTMVVVTTTSARYARGFENGKAVADCYGLRGSLDTFWPSLKHFN